jgi:hypothetical protein
MVEEQKAAAGKRYQLLFLPDEKSNSLIFEGI